MKSKQMLCFTAHNKYSSVFTDIKEHIESLRETDESLMPFGFL